MSVLMNLFPPQCGCEDCMDQYSDYLRLRLLEIDEQISKAKAELVRQQLKDSQRT